MLISKKFMFLAGTVFFYLVKGEVCQSKSLRVSNQYCRSVILCVISVCFGCFENTERTSIKVCPVDHYSGVGVMKELVTSY